MPLRKGNEVVGFNSVWLLWDYIHIYVETYKMVDHAVLALNLDVGRNWRSLNLTFTVYRKVIGISFLRK